MRVAVPVHNEGLKSFTNAGHAPFFAVFDVSGNGAFRSVKLAELRANPRVNLEAEDGCEHERQPESEPLEECGYESKRDELRSMTSILSDCSDLIAAKVCKNAARAFKEAGINVRVISGLNNARDIVGDFIAQHI
ncbi:MAG: hypothetical protein LBQ52_00080 [Helicobacteraceae bacterium]|jgi:predicted Fe-Mo cluster-binding NifX family protein|nr:hypothetical protein [Helicobacteraceae bacterium]